MDHTQPSLSESEAQRVLARAAEIDAQGGPSVPLERLRLAALEAGLTPAAFEAALAEVREARIAPLPPANPWPRLARYAGAIVGTGVVLVAGASVLNDVESAWLVRKLLDPVALGLGAALAMRFKVRPLAILLGGLAVATGAEFLMDMWAGQPAIRGAEPHFGLMIAGVAGVLLGSLLRRSSGGPDAQPETVAQPVRESTPPCPTDAAMIVSAGWRRLLLMPSIAPYLLLAMLVGALPVAAHAQSPDDEKAVIAIADSALAAITRGDAVAFTDLMIPEAMLYPTSTRGGVTMYRVRSREAQRAAGISGVVERGFAPWARVSGGVAVVWMPYDLYVNGSWSHCGADVFTLVKSAGAWRIASMAWSAEQPPVCEKHPAGPPARP